MRPCTPESRGAAASWPLEKKRSQASKANAYAPLGDLTFSSNDQRSDAGEDADRFSQGAVSRTDSECEVSLPESIEEIAPLRGASRFGHHIPWQEYLAIGFWLALLLGQYGSTRFLCNCCSIPSGESTDCNPGLKATMRDIQFLLFMGFVLGILTGVHCQDRFLYLFCFGHPRPRGWAFVTIFFLTSPVYSWISDLAPAFSFKGELSKADILGLLFVISILVCPVIWHVVVAIKYKSCQESVAYFLSCFLAWILIAIPLIGAKYDSQLTPHLHHYVVAYAVATIAQFNHPLSLVLLAIASGVFVQGIAVYGADPIIIYKHRWVEFQCPGVNVSSPHLGDPDMLPWIVKHCSGADVCNG